MPRVAPVLIASDVGLLWFFLRNADMAQVWAEMPGPSRTAHGRRARDRDLRPARCGGGNPVPLRETHFSNAFQATVMGLRSFLCPPGREVIRPLLLARRGLPATAALPRSSSSASWTWWLSWRSLPNLRPDGRPSPIRPNRPTSRGSGRGRLAAAARHALTGVCGRWAPGASRPLGPWVEHCCRRGWREWSRIRGVVYAGLRVMRSHDAC